MIDSRTAPLMTMAEWLCRTVAQHDLDGTPLYAVPQSRLSAKFGQSCGPFGYTTLDLDLLLKAEIGDAWQGRGACVVVNDAAIIAEDLPETAADFCGVADQILSSPSERCLFIRLVKRGLSTSCSFECCGAF